MDVFLHHNQVSIVPILASCFIYHLIILRLIITTNKFNCIRFYIIKGGPSHHYRQDNLNREGLVKPKLTSVIDYYRGEIPSNGIEDQFSKSIYYKKSEIANQGLIEKKKIGKYSPRLQPCNPSGDNYITKSWGKGIDLNVTTTLLRKQHQSASSTTFYNLRPSTVNQGLNVQQQSISVSNQQHSQRPNTSNYY